MSTSMQADRLRSERSSNNNREGVGVSLKSKAKPMQSPDPTLSPSSQGRCGAKTRNGSPCRTWRVTGKSRCRMHGGARGSGAPKGSRNGSYKHGGFTCEAPTGDCCGVPRHGEGAVVSAPLMAAGLDFRSNTRALETLRLFALLP